jgi:predicted Zn-dependent protease
MTAFFWFMSERKASGDLKYMQASEVAKQIAQEWKDMTETEKAVFYSLPNKFSRSILTAIQQYQKMQANDQERYIREHNEVYGVEPKRTKQA